VYIAASIFLGFAVNFAMLLIGRILVGIASGISSVVVPMYLSEIAPARLRGAIGTLNQLLLTVGILVSQLLGIGLSSCPSWRYLLGMSVAGVAILQTILLPFCPKSPRWLASKGRFDEAKEALSKLKPQQNISAELASLKENRSQDSSDGKFSDLFTRPLLRSLIIGVGIQIGQQLSGINAVFFYSTSIFQKAGISNSSVATAIIGAINVLATVVAAFLMDRAGRRPLLLFSQIFQVIFLLSLSFSMIFVSNLGSSAGYILVGSVILFVIGFAVGMGPIPWIIISEIFPAGIRGYAVSVAVGVNWMSNFLVALTFPTIEQALNSYTFILFAGVVFACSIFTFIMVPETKGKSIEELTGKRSDKLND